MTVSMRKRCAGPGCRGVTGLRPGWETGGGGELEAEAFFFLRVTQRMARSAAASVIQQSTICSWIFLFSKLFTFKRGLSLFSAYETAARLVWSEMIFGCGCAKSNLLSKCYFPSSANHPPFNLLRQKPNSKISKQKVSPCFCTTFVAPLYIYFFSSKQRVDGESLIRVHLASLRTDVQVVVLNFSRIISHCQ